MKKELEKLENEVKMLEKSVSRFEFICNKVNLNLCKLNISTVYNGRNSEKIRDEIKSIKNMENIRIKEGKKTIAELEVIYNNLDEQIKIYENRIADSKRMSVEAENRRKLLDKLKVILNNTNELQYLIEPITNLIGDLENSISFNKYIISDSTIKDMKKQREMIKQEILCNDYRFKRFNVDEKIKAVAIIEDYLNEDIMYNDLDLKEKRKQIKQIKEKIRILQNTDDIEKVEAISNSITNLYKSAGEVSELVKHDVNLDGFKIQYIKKGNIIQPMISNNGVERNDDIKVENSEKYYTGSMARHTLMQLSGYLSFLELLIKENRYPVVPILVIDHISKPFDDINRRAIGVILQRFYEKVDESDIQIFMFDDKNSEELLITNASVNNLVSDSKSGFNPFYHEAKNN